MAKATLHARVGTDQSVARDTSFLTDARPYLTAWQAAKYVGYEPQDNGLHRDDPAMRAFYEWVRKSQVPKLHRGRRTLLFRRSDLDAAIGEPIVRTATTRRGQVMELARRMARGER